MSAERRRRLHLPLPSSRPEDPKAQETAGVVQEDAGPCLRREDSARLQGKECIRRLNSQTDLLSLKKNSSTKNFFSLLLWSQDIFKQATEDRLTSANELPYFEGDFWPNVLEESIKELEQEEEERKKEENTAASETPEVHFSHHRCVDVGPFQQQQQCSYVGCMQESKYLIVVVPVVVAQYSFFSLLRIYDTCTAVHVC